MSIRIPAVAQQLVLAFFLTALFGCGDSGRVPVYPVRGKVLLDGKPAKGASLKFIATNPTEKTKWMIPKGIADEGGNYQLDTYASGDGAPEGEYSVFVNWPSPEEGEVDTAPENLEEIRDKYADRKNPQLHATVQLASENESGEIIIPAFELSVDEYFEDGTGE